MSCSLNELDVKNQWVLDNLENPHTLVVPSLVPPAPS